MILGDALKTFTTKCELAVEPLPSVTVKVMVTEPDCPAIGVTFTVYAVALLCASSMPLGATIVGLFEEAVTVKVVATLSPTVNANAVVGVVLRIFCVATVVIVGAATDTINVVDATDTPFAVFAVRVMVA